MFDTSNLFNVIFIIPILNALIALYKGLLVLHVPGALGFALILLTVIIRLLLHPLTAAQMKSAHKLSKLKPELDKLTAQHKDDKQRLQTEQMRLYKESGVNPAAGCLPLLLQMPILIAIYNLFFQILNADGAVNVVERINQVVYHSALRIDSLDLSFFGLNLASKPSQWQTAGWWLLGIPIITAVLQYYQTKLMTPNNASLASKASSLAPAKSASSGQAPKKDKELTTHNAPPTTENKEDMAAAMQKQMAIMMPLMIGFFAYSFPVGLAFYWNTFTIFGILQQKSINKQK